MREPVFHLCGEGGYFHQLETELIEKMRRRGGLQQRRQRVADVAEIYDPAVLDAIERLGYDGTTIMLLFVAPLVQVAWTDGSITQAERDYIVAIASLRGVKPNAPAYQRLMGWLDQRPPEEFFEGTLYAIEAVFQLLPPTERQTCRDAFLFCCRDIAAATCRHPWRLSRPCSAKREATEKIDMRLHSKQTVSG